MSDLTPINGNLSAGEAEAIALWHHEHADMPNVSTRDRERHEMIAFRLQKAAAARRRIDATMRAAA